jgi:hypothetical protein
VANTPSLVKGIQIYALTRDGEDGAPVNPIELAQDGLDPFDLVASIGTIPFLIYRNPPHVHNLIDIGAYALSGGLWRRV